MKACVVDAGVIAAALFQEEQAAAAQVLLRGDRPLHAPDLIHAEVANVIWKRHGRGEIDMREALQLLADVLALPLEVTPSGELASAALLLAMLTGRTVYDCLYLALAVKADTVMVTTDRRLVNALGGGPLEEHVAWIGRHY